MQQESEKVVDDAELYGLLEASGAGATGRAPKIEIDLDLTESARRTGVVGLVALAAPQALAAEAQGDLDDLVASHDLLLRVARGIAGVAAEADVTLAFRKGIDVTSLYPSRSCRRFGDVDVYLAPEEFQRFESAMAGTRIADLAGNRTQELFLKIATDTCGSWRVQFGQDVGVVDVAVRLGLPAMGCSPDAIPRMLSERQMSVDGLPVLSDIDRVVDLCVNIAIVHGTLRYVAKGRHRKLGLFTDLLVTTTWFGQADWERFIDRAVELGARSEVYFAFGNLARVFPKSDGAGIFESALSSWGTDSELDAVGLYELAEPYMWRTAMPGRLFEPVPLDLPAHITPLE